MDPSGRSKDPGPPPLRRYFVRGAGGILMLQGMSTGLVVVASFILARSLGASGLGTYGVTGAAITSAAGLVAWNTVLAWRVSRLGLRSTVLGRWLGGSRSQG